MVDDAFAVLFGALVGYRGFGGQVASPTPQSGDDSFQILEKTETRLAETPKAIPASSKGRVYEP